MVRADSVAWGGITTLLDRTLESGWIIRNTETGERQFKDESLLKGKGFDIWLRELLTQYFVFSNAFGEIVYSPSGNVKELHVVDPTQMKINTDNHGEILSYEQRVFAANTSIVLWKPEEILHIAEPSLGQNVWGEVSLRTLYQAVSMKFHIKKFLLWLFETNQFRGIYNPKGADVEAVRRFISFMKESEKQISKPVIVEGEFEYKIMREMRGFDEVKNLLYKMDEEILNLLQVPPIYAGLPDNSNRSNSDAQERAFNTRIRSIHSLFKYHLDELLRRAKLYKKEVVFSPLNAKSEKEVLEIAQIMKSISMKDDVIADYLRGKGFDLPRSSVFEELQNANDLLTQDQSPSRRGKGVDKTNEVIGSGEESSTRQEQVSRSGKFKKYPYVFEVPA